MPDSPQCAKLVLPHSPQCIDTAWHSGLGSGLGSPVEIPLSPRALSAQSPADSGLPNDSTTRSAFSTSAWWTDPYLWKPLEMPLERAALGNSPILDPRLRLMKKGFAASPQRYNPGRDRKSETLQDAESPKKNQSPILITDSPKQWSNSGFFLIPFEMANKAKEKSSCSPVDNKKSRHHGSSARTRPIGTNKAKRDPRLVGSDNRNQGEAGGDQGSTQGIGDASVTTDGIPPPKVS